MVYSAGQTEAVQLTFDEEDANNIAEYYIDASPDNTQLLVVDANTCSYPYNVVFGLPFLPEGGCAYYYVNIADGSLTAIPEMNAQFVPKFFHQMAQALSVLYPVEVITLLRSFDPSLPSSAIASRTDLAQTRSYYQPCWYSGMALVSRLFQQLHQ